MYTQPEPSKKSKMSQRLLKLLGCCRTRQQSDTAAEVEFGREQPKKAGRFVSRLNAEMGKRQSAQVIDPNSISPGDLFVEGDEKDEKLAEKLWKDLFAPLCELLELNPNARNIEYFPGSENCRCGPSSLLYWAAWMMRVLCQSNVTTLL